ncbi:MAG: hypothetical protein P1S60_05540 [Anaerolineae bacterium]|nr:hypothetical protein [Anaerolineae bacterium]
MKPTADTAHRIIIANLKLGEFLRLFTIKSAAATDMGSIIHAITQMLHQPVKAQNSINSPFAPTMTPGMTSRMLRIW